MRASTIVYNEKYRVATIRRNYMTGVFGWMTIALLITGLIGDWIGSLPMLTDAIDNNQELFIMLFLIEIFMVIGLRFWVERLSVMTTMLILLGYAVLNGLTITALFYILIVKSVTMTFYILAVTCGIMAFYGYLTGKDLLNIRKLMGSVGIGILVATFVHFFMESGRVYWIVSYIGILVFSGILAFDIQRIRKMSDRASFERQAWMKSAVAGALVLYLDMMIVFLFFLRLFPVKRSRL